MDGSGHSILRDGSLIIPIESADRSGQRSPEAGPAAGGRPNLRRPRLALLARNGLERLSVPARRLMATRVMHRGSMKFRSVWCRRRAARGHWPLVTLSVVELMIHVPVEMLRSVEPGPRANKHPSRKPLRPIVAIGSTRVRRSFVISVGTNRCRPDRYRNMRRSAATRKENAEQQSHDRKSCKSLHDD